MRRTHSQQDATIVCVTLTSNLKWQAAPGNVLLDANATGLPKESVANASRIATLDRSALTERVGRLQKARFDAVLDGVQVVIGR